MFMYMSLQTVIGLSGKSVKSNCYELNDNVHCSQHCGGLFQSAKTEEDQEIVSPGSYVLYFNNSKHGTAIYNTTTGWNSITNLMARIPWKAVKMTSNISAVYNSNHMLIKL